MNHGDCFVCECNGLYGNPPANVIWYRESEQIATLGNLSSLRLPSVSKNDSGTYRCVVTSMDEKAKSETSFRLIVP